MVQERHERSQTKIIATIGPATSSKEVLRQLFYEGIDVCRLNFSHGKHEDHLKVIKNIKELNEEINCNVAMLADLQGPKLRIGEVESGVVLEDGKEIEFTNQKVKGNASRVYMSYTEFPKDVNIGDSILIDDGKLKLEATYTNREDTVRARVVHGGPLSSKKGVNLPSTKISLPSLTEKDIEDARFALDHDVDWIALSFVRTVMDIVELKEIIKKKKKHAKVIAKIEKPEALEFIDEIIDMTDGVMVARGDLGVEVPFDRVPLIQKEIVHKCIENAKPVIIATQMMESMIENFRPTRAEANDVANAVLDGADAVMLSGETSVGKYPIEVIRSMQQIIDWTERNGYEFYHGNQEIEMSHSFISDTLCSNASELSKNAGARAIVTFTFTGYTAFRLASHRPDAGIYALTANKHLLRQMSLIWGVRAFYHDEFEDINKCIEKSNETLKKEKLLKDDDLVIHVAGLPLKKKGRANMMKLTYI